MCMVVLPSLWHEVQKYSLPLITQSPLNHTLQISTVTDLLYSNICFVVRRINVRRRLVNIYDRCLWKFARSVSLQSSWHVSNTRPAFLLWVWIFDFAIIVVTDSLGLHLNLLFAYLESSLGKCLQASWFRVKFNSFCCDTKYNYIIP